MCRMGLTWYQQWLNGNPWTINYYHTKQTSGRITELVSMCTSLFAHCIVIIEFSVVVIKFWETVWVICCVYFALSISLPLSLSLSSEVRGKVSLLSWSTCWMRVLRSLKLVSSGLSMCMSVVLLLYGNTPSNIWSSNNDLVAVLDPQLSDNLNPNSDLFLD